MRELTASDLKAAMKFDQLPESVRAVLRTRGPQVAPTKEQISIRLSREALEGFRAFGDGWQTRMDGVLREWLETHRPA